MHCIEFCVTSSTFTGSENCCVTSSAAADWCDATEAKGGGITSISRCFWHCEVVRKGHKCFPHVPHISDQLRPAFAWLVYHFLLYWQFQPNPLSPLLPGKSKRRSGRISKSFGKNITEGILRCGCFSTHSLCLLIMGLPMAFA